jgi:hypothetical protein
VLGHRRAYLLPILVGVALAMRSFAAPPLMKFTLAGSAASFEAFMKGLEKL